MRRKDIKARYDAMMETAPYQGYDGRGKGIDVYVCNKCGHKFYSVYRDRGVTPFTMACEGCGKGTALHEYTVPTREFDGRTHVVHVWVRPTFEEMMTLPKSYREHILNGGLILLDVILEAGTIKGRMKTVTKNVRMMLVGIYCDFKYRFSKPNNNIKDEE